VLSKTDSEEKARRVPAKPLNPFIIVANAMRRALWLFRIPWIATSSFVYIKSSLVFLPATLFRDQRHKPDH